MQTPLADIMQNSTPTSPNPSPTEPSSPPSPPCSRPFVTGLPRNHQRRPSRRPLRHPQRHPRALPAQRKHALGSTPAIPSSPTLTTPRPQHLLRHLYRRPHRTPRRRHPTRRRPLAEHITRLIKESQNCACNDLSTKLTTLLDSLQFGMSQDDRD